MKVGALRFIVVAVIAVLVILGGSTTAWGEEAPPPCPTSPNFTPDFGVNQNCLVLNGTHSGFPAFVPSNPTVLRLTDDATSHVSGSAWFGTQQPVSKGFSTTFQFKITHTQLLGGPSGPADGIAFVIQNSDTGTAALGGSGGAIGYGAPDTGAGDTGVAIPESLAIEFDTYKNDWDPDANHVAVQSCGIGANSQDHTGICSLGIVPSAQLGTTLATGTHIVTITYVPPPCSDCSGTLDVILDNKDLFPTPVSVTLDTQLNLNNGTAWVGFTGSTGGSVESNDILSWTFTPQAQSTVVTTGQTSTVPFQNDAYNYTAQLNNGSPTTAQVTPIILSQSDCDNLIHRNGGFPGAHCFIYQNALGLGNDSPVIFRLTCPQLSPTGDCNPLDADLGTQFDLSTLNVGLGFNPSNPFPGWLKGNGGIPGDPCATADSVTLFHSNQVSSFTLSRVDPFTKGKSGGTGSCWVATFNTPNEAPTVAIAAPVNNGVYQQNQSDASTNANYTCTTVNNTVNNVPGVTGPYLTQTSCSATDAPGGSIANGAHFDTATLGTHTFTATVVDSATDNASSTVTYNVVGATDLAILNLAAPRAPVNSTLTYAIGVGDLGGATAVGVMVTDTLPAGLSAQSASGKNVSCAVVNRRLTCTTTPFTCTVGPTVTCPVGPIAPLSWSSLNGATIQIKATVTAIAGTVLKDTAMVSSSNADSRPSNNSSTATTVVTH